MSRPKKNTIDYFPHHTHHGQTMFILEERFGNDGYALWFKLLEMLGATENHVIRVENPAIWEYLRSKFRTGEKTKEILDLLATLGAIDAALWSQNIIWCQKFVDGIADVYVRNRQSTAPSKPVICVENSVSNAVNPALCGINRIGNPQSKVKESKVKKSKVVKTIVSQARQLEIQKIFEFWQLEHRHPQSRLDDVRLKAINNRLESGYTSKRICDAIKGIKLSSYHMGQNDRNTVYDDIELICRSGANVDKFADLLAGGNIRQKVNLSRYEKAGVIGGTHGANGVVGHNVLDVSSVPRLEPGQCNDDDLV